MTNNVVTVTRHYQLVAESTFEASTPARLLRVIQSDRRHQREGGDVQGITYSVATASDARQLGAYETIDGLWAIGELQIFLGVDNASEVQP
jgi:hypothetical protein